MTWSGLSAGTHTIKQCRTKPAKESADVQAEMRQGLSYFHSTIFTSLPLFYRRIDTALKQVSPHCLFRFVAGGGATPLFTSTCMHGFPARRRSTGPPGNNLELQALMPNRHRALQSHPCNLTGDDRLLASTVSSAVCHRRLGSPRCP